MTTVGAKGRVLLTFIFLTILPVMHSTAAWSLGLNRSGILCQIAHFSIASALANDRLIASMIEMTPAEEVALRNQLLGENLWYYSGRFLNLSDDQALAFHMSHFMPETHRTFLLEVAALPSHLRAAIANHLITRLNLPDAMSSNILQALATYIFQNPGTSQTDIAANLNSIYQTWRRSLPNDSALLTYREARTARIYAAIGQRMYGALRIPFLEGTPPRPGQRIVFRHRTLGDPMTALSVTQVRTMRGKTLLRVETAKSNINVVQSEAHGMNPRSLNVYELGSISIGLDGRLYAFSDADSLRVDDRETIPFWIEWPLLSINVPVGLDILGQPQIDPLDVVSWSRSGESPIGILSPYVLAMLPIVSVEN